jgi:hypothetical protein
MSRAIELDEPIAELTMRNRRAQDKLPHIWMLDPSGNPVKMQLARNINNGVLRVDADGSVSLVGKSRKSGWRTMQSACTPREWAFWDAFDKACESGKRLRRPPKEKLPACIGKSAPSVKEDFVFDDPSPDSDLEDDAPVKRTRAKKDPDGA